MGRLRDPSENRRLLRKRDPGSTDGHATFSTTTSGTARIALRSSRVLTEHPQRGGVLLADCSPFTQNRGPLLPGQAPRGRPWEGPWGQWQRAGKGRGLTRTGRGRDRGGLALVAVTAQVQGSGCGLSLALDPRWARLDEGKWE